MSKGPFLPNLEPIFAAGIDPKTGLLRKMGASKESFKQNNKKLLRIVDEQDAVNRFTWTGLPHGLTEDLIERLLYYKGQGMFFYMKENDQFYFLPYALDGSIDVYGRFTAVTPLPFNGTTDNEGKQKPWITGLTRKPLYDIQIDALTEDDFYNSCVLLHDYTPQISQINIPRQILNDPLLDIMSNCIPYLNTCLRNGTGVNGLRVNSEDEAANVMAANDAIDNAALIGQWGVPILGNIDFQQLTSGATGKAEEFLLALQGLDSYRLSLYGLPSGGLFQKKAHMLEAEQNMNAGTASLVLQDSLKRRQTFCDIINSNWGLNMGCEINETITQMDMDRDAALYETNTPEQQAIEQTNYEGGMEE